MRFLRRFRIVVRRNIYFERRMARFGPAYAGCPVDCSGPKADPRNGCPKCEYTIQRIVFEKETEKELRDKAQTKTEGHDYPLKYLLECLTVVSNADARAGKGYNSRWTVIVARLVEIYRSELAKMRANDSWNHLQHLKAIRESLGPRGRNALGPPPGEDDDVE